jgi:hypothetical protein
MTDDASSHVDTSRLVAFLVNETPLTTEEHQHILRCEECTNRMATSAAEELRKPQPPET